MTGNDTGCIRVQGEDHVRRQMHVGRYLVDSKETFESHHDLDNLRTAGKVCLFDVTRTATQGPVTRVG